MAYTQTNSPTGIGRATNEPGQSFGVDIEQKAVGEALLQNTTVQNFSWSGITFTVRDRVTKQPKQLLNDINGIVHAGEMCALMGPSGSGKTTLLNVLANRDSGSSVGRTFINGAEISLASFRSLSSFVEQEDALIGSLTVRETMNFAARLANLRDMAKSQRISRIEGLLDSFGLRNQADSIIGTSVRRGISGGQKRRVSVASQLITGPKMLFLDEPTSGLDSAASFEVMSFIRAIAKQNHLVVIASIHQPSTSTFQLFDKLLLLSGGKPHYFGPVSAVGRYYESIGHPMPLHMNPAEFVLDLMNTDFAIHQATAADQLEIMQTQWIDSASAKSVLDEISRVSSHPHKDPLAQAISSRSKFFTVVVALTHRSFIKSYRDLVAYGIRIAMYTGLAIMMGTVWLRLKDHQSDIQPFINAIFFGSAFMSFMAVAYVPSFLEDRLTFIKERANGLYGATAFMISNFLIGLPYLFLITVIFSCIAYWLSGFQPTAKAFFTWIMWLYLDLIAAESLVVLVSSLFPVFVISLALIAFANGLWMSVGGFLVNPTILNVFWRYVFHYIDYQTYVFQGMMVSEFADRTYHCDSDCQCSIPSELSSQCLISGKAVLGQYGYAEGRTGRWVGYLLIIVLGYRLLGWVALVIRK